MRRAKTRYHRRLHVRWNQIVLKIAVRNAISLGGDADTLAAIAGPIAEALHGISQDIKEQAEDRYLR